MSALNRPIRVLVVDDSPFMRHVLTKYLDAEPEISVVGQARDGEDALKKVKAFNPDVVTLDVDMPRMDGLAALQCIMAEYPTPVIMLSALTQQGASITVQALMRGAVDFVPKPAMSTNIYSAVEELIGKIKAIAGIPLAPLPLPLPPMPTARSHKGPQPLQDGDPVIVIGASTGGPRALHQVLSDLPADLPAAVVLVQHMPTGFTGPLAQRINQHSSLTVQEAASGDRLGRGLALLAPGDFHLRFKSCKQVFLYQGPQRNHLRPAVDVSMESAVEHFGSNVIGVVLTGMGSDGTDGARQIKAAGGKVIAEHESTSVIHSMPGSVIEAGLADLVLPLPQVASTLVELVG
jgi:two-component system chemotaxis response regulator CheB